MSNGSFSFGTLQSFLADQPLSFKGQIPSSLTEFGIRQALFGSYLQDDWHFKPSLTFNLGLRHEMVIVPAEVENRLENLQYLSNPACNARSPLLG
jgi:hypothetical protein